MIIKLHFRVQHDREPQCIANFFPLPITAKVCLCISGIKKEKKTLVLLRYSATKLECNNECRS